MRSIILWLLLLQVTILHAQDTLQLPAHASTATISSGEYFFGADPGFGSGTSFSTFLAGSAVSFVSSESIATLSTGVHALHVRVRDTAGAWSMTNSRFLYIVDPLFSFPSQTIPVTINRLEYFTDVDPGFGNGTSISFPASLTAGVTNIPVDISGLGTGVHAIHFRFRDSSGSWSHTTAAKVALVSVDINLPEGPASDSIYALEYFFDTDPGRGNGTQLSVPATVQLGNYTFSADISGLGDGTHQLFVRTLRGPSLTTMYGFTIGQPLPVRLLSFGVQQQGDDALLSWKAANGADILTFIPEAGTDGIAFHPLGSVAALHKDGHVYTFSDRNTGRYQARRIYYRLKATEADGRYSYTPVVSLDPGQSRSLAYPNPFSERIHIVPAQRLEDNTTVIIKILDMAGRCVYEGQQSVVSGKLSVAPGALQPGHYLISVEAGSYKEIFRLTGK